MKYTLSQIIDKEELSQLYESFSQINGTVTAILDLQGNVLVATGWQAICTHFHRMNPETRKRCIESDTLLAGRLKEGEKYALYQCKNGLIDVAVPIMVENEHVGNFFTGQFFTEKPDTEYFRQQARQFGFDEKGYLTALEKIPVLSEEQIKKNVEFLVNLTETIAKIGLKNLKNTEQAKQLEEAKEKAETSERKLKSVSDNMLDLVAVTDLKGNYKFAGASHKILGYDTEYLIGKNVMDFVHPDDLPTVQAEFISFLENKTDKAKSTYRNLCADGSYLWFETIGTLICDENDNPIEILFNTRDITERKKAEKVLKESEERFKNMFELHSAIMLLIDPITGTIINANEAALKFYGYNKTVLCSQNISEINHLSPEQIEIERYNALNEKRNYFIFPHKLANGKIRTVEVHSSPIDYQGKRILFSIIHDITDRKKAEEALKKSEANLNQIIDKSSDVIWIQDLSFRTLYMSQSVKKLLGFSVEEYVTMPINERLPEQSLQIAKKELSENLEKVRSGYLDIRTHTFIFEMQHKHKNGNMLWGEVNCSFLFNADLKPTGIHGITRDITDRKKAEQALKESEANLKFLNTMVNEAFNLQDIDSIYRYISSKLSEILPDTLVLFLSVDETNEESRLENFSGINNRLFKKILKVMSFNPVGKNFKLQPDFKKLYKTGKLIDIKKGLPEFTKSVLPSYVANGIGKTLGIHKTYTIGIFRDESLLANFHFFTFNKKEITNYEFIEAYVKQAGLILQIKKAELKLKEANNTKDQFISILSHDLKNPFSALVGLSDLLIENIDEYDIQNIRKYAATINKGAKQTYTLLNNLLEWSRSRQDEIPFNPQTTNVYLLAYESYMLLNESAKAKEISIELDIPEEITAKVDSEMIKTIIRNLLSNAIKFTPEHGTISISACEKQTFIQVEISDNGTGMKPEILDSLFKIGKIQSKPGTKGERGTGFGLLLCKEFVDKHKGKIWAESEPGKGSKFIFTLPTLEAVENPSSGER